MTYKHGVYKYEVPTSLVPPVHTEAGLPVFVGTAPVHLAAADGALENVNAPQLVHSYAEAVELFGWSDDWAKYTLCEVIYSQFALFNVSPCVLINVLDPERHREHVAGTAFPVVDGMADLGEDVILARGVTVGGVESPEAGVDYSTGYDGKGHAVLSIIKGGKLDGAASVTVSFDRIVPGDVDEMDIIGGVDGATGDYKGLELVDRVFPKFRLVPGLLAAPGWSERPGVAAVMRAKMEAINGHFTGLSVVDVPSGEGGAQRWSEAPEWKQLNNYAGERQIACWPKVKLGSRTFHLSTQLIGSMNRIDAANQDVPYESPSNKQLQMDSCVTADGREVSLGQEQANYLNGEGIVTALNWIGGWRAWGNRTAVYPAATDPKDAFIPIRRMFDWIGNEFILTFWQKVDKPMTPRLIRSIVNSFNVRLNGLAAREFILGGRIEFLETENALTDLMDGILRFHIYLTPPPPAEQIVGILEFDPQYLTTLFDSVSTS